MNAKSYTVEEALEKLKHYCSYRERCHQEVIQKLKSLGMIELSRDVIVSKLITEGYLNETRFATIFARDKFYLKHWGKPKIEYALKMRDIGTRTIALALAEIPQEDYMSRLYALADKRLKSINETNIYKRRKKLADYLLYRGWESHLVYDVIKQLIP